MLLTALEIIAFIAVAAVIGVILGWVLRAALGREQAEISELRAQIRQMKKVNRESKAEKAVASTTQTQSIAEMPAPVAKSAQKTETKAPALAKAATSKTAGKVPASKAKKTSVKKAPVKQAKNKSTRKSLAEREAEQAVGKKAFSEVVSRRGKAETEDDLVKIYGIGKRYAELLNDLGISSYRQISMLKKADVRSLATALGVHDDRLETEDWVGSAKKLLKAKK